MITTSGIPIAIIIPLIITVIIIITVFVLSIRVRLLIRKETKREYYWAYSNGKDETFDCSIGKKESLKLAKDMIKEWKKEGHKNIRLYLVKEDSLGRPLDDKLIYSKGELPSVYKTRVF